MVNKIRTYSVEGFVGAVKGHVVCDECEMPLVNVDSVGFEDCANFSHAEKIKKTPIYPSISNMSWITC